MKLNQFLSLMNGIEEVMENDDVDIVVVEKDGGGGRIGGSDLKILTISVIFSLTGKISKFKFIITISISHANQSLNIFCLRE